MIEVAVIQVKDDLTEEFKNQVKLGSEVSVVDGKVKQEILGEITDKFWMKLLKNYVQS